MPGPYYSKPCLFGSFSRSGHHLPILISTRPCCCALHSLHGIAPSIHSRINNIKSPGQLDAKGRVEMHQVGGQNGLHVPEIAQPFAQWPFMTMAKNEKTAPISIKRKRKLYAAYPLLQTCKRRLHHEQRDVGVQIWTFNFIHTSINQPG